MLIRRNQWKRLLGWPILEICFSWTYNTPYDYSFSLPRFIIIVDLVIVKLALPSFNHSSSGEGTLFPRYNNNSNNNNTHKLLGTLRLAPLLRGQLFSNHCGRNPGLRLICLLSADPCVILLSQESLQSLHSVSWHSNQL